jgi:hypothetical protein
MHAKIINNTHAAAGVGGLANSGTTSGAAVTAGGSVVGRSWA